MLVVERILGLLCLLLLSFGVGSALLLSLLPRSEAARMGHAARTLLGMLCLAAAMHCLATMGTPRNAILAIAGALGTFGLWRWIVGASAAGWTQRRPRPMDLAFGAMAAGLVATPCLYAATAPLAASDAVLIWLPKAEAAAADAPLDLLASGADHQCAFYPRGAAWLAQLAMPWGMPCQQTLRLVPLSAAWLTAWAMHSIGCRLEREREGFLAAGFFLAIPGVSAQISNGYVDILVAAATLMCGFGLSAARGQAAGNWIATLAAAGAASIKEEGNLLVLLCCCLGLARALRERRLGPLAPAAMAVALLLPFAIARLAVPQTRLDLIGTLTTEPALLLLRAEAALRGFLLGVFDLSQLKMESEPFMHSRSQWLQVSVAVSVVALVPSRWPRRIATTPALCLLAMAFVAQVFTSADVRWHQRTTLDRLALQVAPLLLLAATVRLADARSPGAARPAANPD